MSNGASQKDCHGYGSHEGNENPREVLRRNGKNISRDVVFVANSVQRFWEETFPVGHRAFSIRVDK